MSALVVFVFENKKVSMVDPACEDGIELCDRKYNINLATGVTLEEAECGGTEGSAA
jgi:hypothetical protein